MHFYGKLCSHFLNKCFFFSVFTDSIMAMYWKIAAYKIYSFWFCNNQLSMMSNWSNVLLICFILLKDVKHSTWLKKTCFMMFSKKQKWYFYIYCIICCYSLERSASQLKWTKHTIVCNTHRLGLFHAWFTFHCISIWIFFPHCIGSKVYQSILKENLDLRRYFPSHPSLSYSLSTTHLAVLN